MIATNNIDRAMSWSQKSGIDFVTVVTKSGNTIHIINNNQNQTQDVKSSARNTENRCAEAHTKRTANDQPSA